MSFTYDFCLTRAREEATTAEKATLDNVRDRALRSEAAWMEMANRELQIQAVREKARREKEAAALLTEG
ncbi:MAG: hypothetical protein P0Y56_17050 [Candidatus Andeanibacterium colombiense]|uniref:Uncharacterized protein n=1 Tax=Candidatus Andeanibacterium colombiense TaxID=3121345 RepID=A0AAJ6BPR8_9SPHN|nr:MAG: hypothetical protein P0Y56_17050 [Sphingomonadaceae bacterium]